jgi:hypothetical protein
VPLYLQKDNCLVLGALANPHVGALCEILGGLVRAAIFATIYASAGVCVCVDGD